MVLESVCGSDLKLEALEQAVTKHGLDGGQGRRGPSCSCRARLEWPAARVRVCPHGVGACSLRPKNKVIKTKSLPSSSSPEETEPPESRVSGRFVRK